MTTKKIDYKSTKRTIVTTKNYRLFKVSEENRVLNLPKHRKLKQSMIQNGYIKSFPIICVREEKGHLVVKDGQHRLALAEELGLPISYVVEEHDFDVALVNCTSKIWSLVDYAMKYASNGNKQYEEGLAFADRHGLPIGAAFALLAGTTSFGNIADDFCTGKFKIKEKDYAETVAATYCTMIDKSKNLRGTRFLEACMAACRLDNFKPSRLFQGATKCAHRLIAYSTRDAYLDMIEEVYNYHRKQLVSLKIPALQMMRERNAIGRNNCKNGNK